MPRIAPAARWLNSLRYAPCDARPRYVLASCEVAFGGAEVGSGPLPSAGSPRLASKKPDVSASSAALQ